MFGQNPIRPPAKGDGSTLEVQSIFLTFQGEGPYTGWPAVFIRLGGCNLACGFCDTEFESFTSRSLQEILHTIEQLNSNTASLVVITGGEPLRQPIAPLCEALLKKGYTIQLESNGTLYRPLPEEVEIVCSPKPGKQGYAPIRPDVLAHTIALKFLVSQRVEHHNAIVELGQSTYNIPVYIQPLDEQDAEKNKENLALALELAGRYGARISLQTHKLMGIE